jgi:hypothetical protein
MFSTSINLGKRFLMEKNSISIPIEGLLQNLHHYHIVVKSSASLIVNRGYFKLIISDLVMLGLERNTDLEEFSFNFIQNRFNFNWHLAIVMIGELLVFGPDLADKGATCEEQVRPLEVGSLRHHEELLLETEVEEDVLRVLSETLQ